MLGILWFSFDNEIQVRREGDNWWWCYLDQDIENGPYTGAQQLWDSGIICSPDRYVE